MAIAFRDVSSPPLQGLTVTAPDGAIIGVVGEEGVGKRVLLDLAAGRGQPQAGQVTATDPRRLIGATDPLNLAPVGTLLLEHALAFHDAVVRARTRIGLERLRRTGSTILLVSHEPDLLGSVCDEIWWLQEGRLAAKGDPGEVLEKYSRHVARRLQQWGDSVSQPLTPSMRRGDGRAEIVNLEALGAEAEPTMVWQSGAPAAVRVQVRFREAVADPVVGIMIRTRIGFEVYGTNTELEKVKLGPCAAGETLQVTYSFQCDLCPQEYTITAASHDPDGVWHDWLEDAIAVSVVDSRYTAGVANLRAKVAAGHL
jgi:ABC-type thiamine transport system ATPase subunit